MKVITLLDWNHVFVNSVDQRSTVIENGGHRHRFLNMQLDTKGAVGEKKMCT